MLPFAINLFRFGAESRPTPLDSLVPPDGACLWAFDGLTRTFSPGLVGLAGSAAVSSRIVFGTGAGLPAVVTSPVSSTLAETAECETSSSLFVAWFVRGDEVGARFGGPSKGAVWVVLDGFLVLALARGGGKPLSKLEEGSLGGVKPLAEPKEGGPTSAGAAVVEAELVDIGIRDFLGVVKKAALSVEPDEASLPRLCKLEVGSSSTIPEILPLPWAEPPVSTLTRLPGRPIFSSISTWLTRLHHSSNTSPMSTVCSFHADLDFALDLRKLGAKDEDDGASTASCPRMPVLLPLSASADPEDVPSAWERM